MSKKQRRRVPRRNAAAATPSREVVERKALEDLRNGRYRDAIDGFKHLLKVESRPAWRTALAEAYAGRARELASKGMLKEALVIWENRAALGDGAAVEPDYVALLVRMGRMEQVLKLYSDEAGLPNEQVEMIRRHLAAAYLAGDETIADGLPGADPVVLHGRPAREALTAYCAGDDGALNEALARIPFRSPYRDWVQLLKALLRLPECPGEAAALVAKVSKDSAFADLRQAAELALLAEEELLEAIRVAGSPAVRFACTLRGWPQARILLWEELNRLGPAPRPETLLRFMFRHREALGGDWMRRRGLRLLMAGYPDSLGWLGSVGAPRASKQETLLLAAWDAERREDLWGQQQCWERYARQLVQEQSAAEPDTGQERSLRIALSLRRCDRVVNLLSKATPSTDPEDLDRLVAGQLEDSLAWDPDDRDTHLRLIAYYRRGKRLKDVRRLLGQASKRWPKDMQVLGAALDAALDSGSFKKASTLAREMLALDPINSGVRERLVKAHLAHARKQVVKGRTDLARKELSEAEEWSRGGHGQDQVDLALALIGLIEDPETGRPDVRDLVDRLGGGLKGHLALVLAGEALRLSPPWLQRTIGLAHPSAAGREDLLAALAGLRVHLDNGGKLSRELGVHLAKALNGAPWGLLSRGETEAACDTLRRCGLQKVRLRVARTALKRWKGDPLFELHAFEAKHAGGHRGRSDQDVYRLEIALERARREGDVRTAIRIEQVLADIDPFVIGPPPFSPGPGTGLSESPPDGELISVMIEALGLDNALEALGIPQEMKRDLKDVARRHGKDAVSETLASFFEMLAGLDEVYDKPAVPPPAPKKGRTRRRSADDTDGDDDAPTQLDLFS